MDLPAGEAAVGPRAAFRADPGLGPEAPGTRGKNERAQRPSQPGVFEAEGTGTTESRRDGGVPVLN